MPVRASALVALLLTLLGGFIAGSSPAATLAVPPPPDSVQGPSPGPVGAARVAYEAAYDLREKGNPTDAIATIEAAVNAIDGVLAGNPDAGIRRDLVDYRSRLEGLKAAAQHDLEAAPPKPEPDNVADDKVLSAPAVETIRPDTANVDVRRWIDFFSGAGHSAFERWLRRSGRYVDLFRAVLQHEGLPPDLVQLVFVESGFNVNARSVSAAVGPWQFVRSTARLFGLTVDQWVDERKDPEKSTVAAARYLKHLYSIFGDWPLVLASYNAGEGAVLRAIKNQGTTNYWDLKLPRQTEDYVPQFMAALAISRDPARYGFDSVELDEPMAFDEVALKGAVDLHAVARLAECSYEELKELNPAVRRGTARGSDGVTTLRVPPSKGAILLHKLEEGATLPGVNLTLKHRVKRGETLKGIAANYGVGAERLARANGIGRVHPLSAGMVLTVPASSVKPAPAHLEPGDPRGSTAYVPQKEIRVPTSLKGQSTTEGRQAVIVKRGETLASIADDNGVTVEQLKAWNHLKSSKVRRGQHLKLREADAPEVALAPADSASLADLHFAHSRGRHHRGGGRSSRGARGAVAGKSTPANIAGGPLVVVRTGDTLEGIAKRHGVKVSDLKRQNGLNGSRIRAGQKLKLPQG